MAETRHRSVFGFVELRLWEAESCVIARVSESGLTGMVIGKGLESPGERPLTEEYTALPEVPCSKDAVRSRKIVFSQLYRAETNPRQVVDVDQPCCRKKGCGGPKLVG